MESNRININVTLNGMSFNLDVPAEEEAYYRLAATNFNALMKEYLSTFPNQPYIEVVAMVAYDLAVQLQKRQTTPEQDKQIKELEELLNSHS